MEGVLVGLAAFFLRNSWSCGEQKLVTNAAAGRGRMGNLQQYQQWEPFSGLLGVCAPVPRPFYRDLRPPIPQPFRLPGPSGLSKIMESGSCQSGQPVVPEDPRHIRPRHTEEPGSQKETTSPKRAAEVTDSEGIKRQRSAEPRQAALPRVALALSGSVAAVKSAELVRELVARGFSVDIIVSKAARHFLEVEYRGGTALRGISSAIEASQSTPLGSPKRVQIFYDEDEWNEYRSVGDSVLHVELAKRNYVFLVAPLCANTLANMALGLCPNLICSVLRAWHYDQESGIHGAFVEGTLDRPVLVAPSMNTYMWHQRITQQHLETLRQRGVAVVEPICKTLACGDTGIGAMAEVETIAARVQEAWMAYAKRLDAGFHA